MTNNYTRHAPLAHGVPLCATVTDPLTTGGRTNFKARLAAMKWRAARWLASGQFDVWSGFKAGRAMRSGGAKGFALISALILAAPAATAQSQYLAAQGVLIVRNDPGGVVSKRANEINQLRAKGIRVELRGQVCLSSCTMYLGLPNTCVFKGTTFGFHGPSYYGTKLSDNDFEYWSQVIASHYPPRLRNWFMSTARYKISDYYRVKGSELIRMGVRECAQA